MITKCDKKDYFSGMPSPRVSKDMVGLAGVFAFSSYPMGLFTIDMATMG